jgi:hypothetical protein
MQFIALVLGFLFFFSTLTYIRLEKFSFNYLCLNQLEKNQREDRRDYNKNQEISFELYQEPITRLESKVQEPAKQGVKQQILYLEMPPHNVKLNLAKIYKENIDLFDSDQKKKSFTALFLRLLDSIYGRYAFYQEVPSASVLILKTLIEQSSLLEENKKVKIEIIEDLALIECEDSKLKGLFYKILRGEDCPSLLQFLYLEPNRRKFEINIHHAPKELIEAIVGDESAAKEIIETRSLLHELGKRYTKSKKKSLVTTSFLTKEMVCSLLKKYHISFEEPEKLLDFSLSRPSIKNIHKFYSMGVDLKGRAKKMGKAL